MQTRMIVMLFIAVGCSSQVYAHELLNVKAIIHVFVLTAPALVQARLGNKGAAPTTGQVVEAEGSLRKKELPLEATSNAIVVKLERVNDKKRKDAQGDFYVGHMSVGQPEQEFSVLFHTLSGHVMLPHIACHQPACNEHTAYSPRSSVTAMDVNLDGTAVVPGRRLAFGNATRQVVEVPYKDSKNGEGLAESLIVRDQVCLKPEKGDGGRRACVDLELLAAYSLPDTPFRRMPNDGIVGLGLEGLSVSPLCSFFGRLTEESKNMLPQFAFTYGEVGGEFHVGGHDETRFFPPLKWLPVENPEEGVWKIAIKSVRVGSRVIDSCEQGCHGLIDSGASLLGVRASKLEHFKGLLSSYIEEEGCQGSELIFDLGDATTLALPPDDYTDASCVPQLGPLNVEDNLLPGIYALGAPMLRHYYAAFDWESKKVGFARSTGIFPKGSKKFLSV